MSADLTPSVTAFAAAAEWTGVCDGDREKWLELRRSMITASDFAALLGEDSYRDALSVYADKVTPRELPQVEDINTGMFWGRVLEQPILTKVAQHYGWAYRPGGALLRSRKYPFIGATLDAEIDRHDGLGWGVNECKNSEIHRYWDEETEATPLNVLIQCQTQMLVTGAPFDQVIALLSRYRLVKIPLDPDEKFHGILAEVGEEFMERLAKLDPPPATALSAKALKRLFPREDGTHVALGPEAAEWTRELEEIAGQLKTLKGRQDEIKNLLRQQIGEASFGDLPEPVGKVCFWRNVTESRAGYTTVVEPSSGRMLRPLVAATMPGEKGPRKAKPKQAVERSAPLETALEASIEQIQATRKRRRVRV